jgi:zinc protease
LSRPSPAFMERQPRLGPARPFRFPLPRTARLSSGLRLLVLEKRDLPLVVLRATVARGAVDDPEGRPGVAYATGQMLLEGAAGKSPIQISAEIRNLGARLAAWVDRDSTCLSLKVLRAHLDEALDLFFEILLRPNFEPGGFERVRAELRSQAFERLSHPTRVADLVLRSQVFAGRVQGAPLLPHPDEIDRLAVRDLVRFHGRCVRPGATLLAAAGDLSLEELEALLAPRLRRWRGAAPPAGRRPRAPVAAPGLVLVPRDGATQSVIRVGRVAPSRRTPDLARIQILATLLGGSFTSRLSQNLRERHGFTYDVHCAFSLGRGPGLFSVSTSVETGDTAAALVEIFRELSRIVSHPPTSREVAKARRLLVEELPARAESIDDLVEAASSLALHGLGMNEPNRLAEELASVSPEELLELAPRLLDPASMTTVVVGDASRVAAPLEAMLGRAVQLELTPSGPLPPPA